MALYTALSRNDILNSLMAVAPGDTIQIAADLVIDELLIPRNLMASLATPVTIRAASIDRPPVMRGISVGNVSLKGNFSHLGSAPQATTVTGLVLDGLRFEATRYTSARDMNGTTRSLIQSDGQGLGWRVCGTAHPSGNLAGYSQNGGWIGLKFGSGSNNIKVQNCIFDGYANALSVGSVQDVTIAQCGFYNNCEDMFKLGSFNGLTLEWNECTDFRAASLTLAEYFGWVDTVPPHADWIQQIARGDNLTIRNNYLNNDDYRVHFALIRHSQLSSGYTTNVLIENNESLQSHPTGMLVTSCDGLTMQRNKISAIGPLNGGGPVIAVGSKGGTDPEQDNRGTLSFTNNESVRIGQGNQDQMVAGVNGNAENNNPSHYPSGFVQIRKDRVTLGARFAGPYGADTGVVVLPTKPLALTNSSDAVMAASPVQDPDFPGVDERRTGVIKVRKNGLAGGASEVRWQTATDTVSRGTIEITGDATYRYFRMTSNNESHLLLPATSMTFKVLYVDPAISSTARSDLSSFSLTLTVAAVPGVFVPTNRLEFPIIRGMYINDQSVMQAAVQGSNWNKPAPALVGAAINTGLSVAQPNVPATYGAGDFIVALAHKSTAATITGPSTGILSAVFASLFANGQGLACVAGFAAAPSATLGSFASPSSTPKSISASYRGVNIATPYYAATPLLSASAAGCAIPGITFLTDDDDNYRLLVWACNISGASFTTPAGFRIVTTTGGAPRITLYESIDPVRTFAGLTVGMSAAQASAGMAMALKLAA